MSATAGFCVAETPTCNEPRPFPKDRPGPLKKDNPGPGRADRITPREVLAPMDNQPAEAGRCFAHRTEPAATAATFA